MQYWEPIGTLLGKIGNIFGIGGNDIGINLEKTEEKSYTKASKTAGAIVQRKLPSISNIKNQGSVRNQTTNNSINISVNNPKNSVDVQKAVEQALAQDKRNNQNTTMMDTV
jgi:hypothetical protein